MSAPVTCKHKASYFYKKSAFTEKLIWKEKSALTGFQLMMADEYCLGRCFYFFQKRKHLEFEALNVFMEEQTYST